MSETTENTKKLLNFIGTKYEKGELDNNSLVQLIELAGMYLNPLTISEYSKQYGLSYNGVKKCRKTISLLNVKFIIDND